MREIILIFTKYLITKQKLHEHNNTVQYYKKDSKWRPPHSICIASSNETLAHSLKYPPEPRQMLQVFWLQMFLGRPGEAGIL